jgi:hypothetical protein
MPGNSTSEASRKMLIISLPQDLATQVEELSEANALEGSEFITLAVENLLEYLQEQGCPRHEQQLANPAFTYGEDDEPVLYAADTDDDDGIG